MVSKTYQDFTPSHKAPPGPTCQRMGEVPAGERFEVSIYLKPRDAGARNSNAADPRAYLAATRATQHAGDFKLVEEFVSEHGLTVVSTEPAQRLIKLSGTATQFQAAFQTTLSRYQDGNVTFRGRSGSLKLPIELHAIVESVLGLDNRPAASPRLVIRPAAVQGDTERLENRPLF